MGALSLWVAPHNLNPTLRTGEIKITIRIKIRSWQPSSKKRDGPARNAQSPCQYSRLELGPEKLVRVLPLPILQWSKVGYPGRAVRFDLWHSKSLESSQSGNQRNLRLFVHRSEDNVAVFCFHIHKGSPWAITPFIPGPFRDRNLSLISYVNDFHTGNFPHTWMRCKLVFRQKRNSALCTPHYALF